MPNRLLCSDLDGTLIPDGRMPEPDGARMEFRRYVALNDVRVVYATGRSATYADVGVIAARLPNADALIADAGASVYYRRNDGWTYSTGWQEHITPPWKSADIMGLLDGTQDLYPQADERQTAFKVSFYADGDHIRPLIDKRLAGVPCNVLWSSNRFGLWLVDVLPANADKRHALQFIRQFMDTDAVVFAGNDGNDLPLLGSDIPSIVVANADQAIREYAVSHAAAGGYTDRLYLATKPYAAGVLEGLQHFWRTA